MSIWNQQAKYGVRTKLILAIVRDLKNLISILHRDNDIYMSTSQLKEQEILRLKQTISLVWFVEFL